MRAARQQHGTNLYAEQQEREQLTVRCLVEWRYSTVETLREPAEQVESDHKESLVGYIVSSRVGLVRVVVNQSCMDDSYTAFEDRRSIGRKALTNCDDNRRHALR